MEWAIEVRNLTAGYRETTVLENISFNVAPGDIFVIIGGSGCGKSTLLKHLIGLFPPRTGRIRILGHELDAADSRSRAAIYPKIGVAFQNGALFGSMTVLDNIVLPIDTHTDLPTDAAEKKAFSKLQLVGLEHGAFLMPSQLSGGMVKRAAIARAMALDPAIIFLDEPSAGLDPVTSAELDRLILDLSASRGITFVIVTHELESISAIAGTVLMLEKEIRGIAAIGPLDELKSQTGNPYVCRFFNRIPGQRNPL